MRGGLGELPGTFMKEVPRDRFSEQPLIYRQEGRGYVVYSVGEDGKDDGGKPPAEQKRYREDAVLRVGE